MRVASIIDISLVDVPGIPVSVLFTAGCNLDCPYCQNAKIIARTSGEEMAIEDIVQRLQGNLTNGYCITGGEPTIHKDLPYLLKELRSEDAKHINLNTQGTILGVLEKSLPFLDSIWFDIKTIPENYSYVTRVQLNPWSKVEQSIKMILDSNVAFWPRTTYVGGLTRPSEILEISQLLNDLGFAGEYTVQNYVKSSGTRQDDVKDYWEPDIDEVKSVFNQIPSGIKLRLDWR